MENTEKKESIILGLDISTSCIGISIVCDNGEDVPKVIKLTHIVPKIPSKIKGVKALILRKEIFEKEFLTTIKDIGITECIIEAPIEYTTSKSSAHTVAQLLQFNGLLSEAVYRVLGLVPNYVTSYDARMQSFPELLSIRKFNKKGEIYPIQHIRKALKENHLILFGSFPFDCDKKSIMMNCICELYPGIEWLYNAKGEIKKENYDACDALVCCLAYINKKRYGDIVPSIVEYTEENFDQNGEEKTKIKYTAEIWGKKYNKELVL